MSDTQDTGSNGAGSEPRFAIHKIFIKDISFESPGSPMSFNGEWKPQHNLDLNTRARSIADNVFEVVLALTVTVKNNNETAYLVEVQQAGIFEAAGFSEPDMGAMLGSFCPNILFPYAREAVSDIVTRGGFPQLLLAPVNFDALYAQHMQQQQQQTENQVAH